MIWMGTETKDDAAAVAAAREAATPGCCKCCSMRSEIWTSFFIDLTSILGLLLEIPRWRAAPTDLHALDEFWGYAIFCTFSAILTLFALFEGRQLAWPRRALVRLMSLKLPIFLIFCIGYFTVSPWAAPLARWVCEHDFESIRTLTAGGDYDACVSMFPWWTTLNNAFYVFAYAYSFKASHEWFRCHPDNDDKGVWCSRAVAAGEGPAGSYQSV